MYYIYCYLLLLLDNKCNGIKRIITTILFILLYDRIIVYLYILTSHNFFTHLLILQVQCTYVAFIQLQQDLAYHDFHNMISCTSSSYKSLHKMILSCNGIFYIILA